MIEIITKEKWYNIRLDIIDTIERWLSQKKSSKVKQACKIRAIQELEKINNRKKKKRKKERKK